MEARNPRRRRQAENRLFGGLRSCVADAPATGERAGESGGEVGRRGRSGHGNALMADARTRGGGGPLSRSVRNGPGHGGARDNRPVPSRSWATWRLSIRRRTPCIRRSRCRTVDDDFEDSRETVVPALLECGGYVPGAPNIRMPRCRGCADRLRQRQRDHGVRHPPGHAPSQTTTAGQGCRMPAAAPPGLAASRVHSTA